MAQRVSAKWTVDKAQITPTLTFQNSSDLLRCPFGTRAGEYEAWRRVRRRALGRATIT